MPGLLLFNHYFSLDGASALSGITNKVQAKSSQANSSNNNNNAGNYTKC